MIDNTPQIDPAQTDDAPQPHADTFGEQAYRAGVYSLLAALLRDHPTAEIIDYASRLNESSGDDKSALAIAFSLVALAARHSQPGALRDEYHALFIGLGRGELVPYGSWYQTGFLMERPLGLLRSDLARLGFERSDDVREPEDHIAALLEVMALMIDDGLPRETQRRFYDAHIGNWAGSFFDDLNAAEHAVFYRSVARLGTAFLDMESRYLSSFD